MFSEQDASLIVNMLTRRSGRLSVEEILQIALNSDVESSHLGDADFSLDIEGCESTDSDRSDEDKLPTLD